MAAEGEYVDTKVGMDMLRTLNIGELRDVIRRFWELLKKAQEKSVPPAKGGS